MQVPALHRRQRQRRRRRRRIEGIAHDPDAERHAERRADATIAERAGTVPPAVARIRVRRRGVAPGDRRINGRVFVQSTIASFGGELRDVGLRIDVIPGARVVDERYRSCYYYRLRRSNSSSSS